MNVAQNTVVSLSYELYDADGGLIEKAQQPLVYLHGHSGIFPLVEQALEGKAVGEACKVRLTPADAFGEYDAELVRVEDRDKFPAEVVVGMQFERGSEDGEDDDALFTITDIAEDKVVVDGNHPLAGQTLNFSCTIADVRAATQEELSHGHVHGAHGHHH